jgi:chloride channel protein, CIC family
VIPQEPTSELPFGELSAEALDRAPAAEARNSSSAAPLDVNPFPETPKSSTAVQWFQRLRSALAMREGSLFLLLAVIIGLFSGLSVVCFRIVIDWTRISLFGSALYPGFPRVVIVPAVAGLVLAFLVVRFFPSVRGSGVTQTKSAVYVYDGYIPFDTVIGKFICCALAIGSGQSLGPEDPSLQMGAGIASLLGRKLRLSREKIRLIAPVGAAAGLAAAFNSPIAAVIFVIEEVIGTWTAGVLGAIVLAAVSSVVVSRWFLGAEPLFRTPTYTLVHPVELLSYAALGVAGGFTSLFFAKLISYTRPKMRALPGYWRYLLPAAAGLVIGVIGIRLPQVMGAGYDFMDQAMHGQFVWYMLFVLALAKIVATTISFSSGAPGGMFAPTLFVGAMLGAAIGSTQHHFFPATAGPIGAYALVGMGTLFAGFLRVPLTSVFMVLEVSGNYSIILPVIISNALAYLISLRFQPTPIFDVLARQDGIDLPSMEELREGHALRVEDAMRAPVAPVLSGDDTVDEALARLEARTEGPAEEFFLVSFPTGRWAGIRIPALHKLASEGKGAAPLKDLLGTQRLPRLHPDQSVDLAMRLMRDWPYLPVVHRADARRLEGVLSLSDVLNSYLRNST